MQPNKIRTLFIAATLAILALALTFGAVLSMGSFKKSLTDAYVSSFVINGGESVRKIEYALKYGKQLDNFFGIQTILQEVKGNNPDVKNVKVILADGRVAYGLEQSQTGVLNSELLSNFKQLIRDEAKKSSWMVVDKQYNVLIEIHDPSGVAIGAMDIVFDESVIAPYASALEKSIMNQTLLVGLIAAVVMVVFFSRMQIINAVTGDLRTTQLLAVVLLVIGVAQAFLTARAIVEFQPVYLSTVQRNQALVGGILQKNLDKVIAKGVTYSGMEKVDDWMSAIPRAMPEIDSIVLLDKASSAALYSTRSPGSSDSATYLRGVPADSMIRVDLAQDAEGVKAQAAVVLSKAYMDSKIRTIIIDAVTLLITTILFSVEIVIFLGIFFHAQVQSQVLSQSIGKISGSKAVGVFSDVSIVRPQAFVFFLGASMATSFLPIILKSFDPILGIPENISLGLPLTVELMASIVSTLITGVVLDRRGWRPPFMTGLLILAFGTLLSALSSNAIMFLLSRLVVGIGYGFAWMSLRGFVASGNSESSRITGFAGLNAGIYAGINCGVILGALLVERLSYSGIFWMSLFLIGVAILFCLAFTVNQIQPHVSDPAATSGNRVPVPTVGALVTERNMLMFFLTVAIPTSVCLMFLNYFVPIYAKTVDISAGDVGRLFLLYGLCVVYLGPVLSRTLIQRYSSKSSTAFSFFLVILGLIVFGFFPSPWTCAFAVVMLGLSDGFGLVAQNNYLLSFNSVKLFGIGKSLSVFSIIKKIGQTAGPLVFGWLSLVYMGIGFLGVVFGCALLVFLWVGRDTRTAAKAAT